MAELHESGSCWNWEHQERRTWSLFQNDEHIEVSREHQLDDSQTMHLDPLISHSENQLIGGLPSILSHLEDEHLNSEKAKLSSASPKSSVAESDSPIIRQCTNSHKMHNFRNSVLSYILNPTGCRRTTTPHLECCCLQKVGLFAYKLGISLVYWICVCLAHLLRFRLLRCDILFRLHAVGSANSAEHSKQVLQTMCTFTLH